MTRDAADRNDKIEALHERFRAGEFSETVYTASLCTLQTRDEIRDAVARNLAAHRDSLPFKRGEVT